MQANASEESIDTQVRRRLRVLRAERQLTLQQVAERAHIDVSTLSRLEAGKRRLALDHIPRLAAALDVTTDDLLSSVRRPDPRIRSEPVTVHGITYWPLTNQGRAGGLLAYKARIAPERRAPPEELAVHEGHDWMYVLDGRLRLLLGDDDLTVEPGEAVEFSTWTPHWFGAVNGAVELIFILGPQGQRIHTHV
ncbi:MAG TPA: helix-turn-helix transcriptional regulator [Acidimicrobiales bacterium]|nr:helix-turn-helix transcriptional regulator [Acidimicrobiales bacterium]